ncbi:MAG: NAD(P)/FAD-dependent oxidoreductase [Halobacteriaceae archaeon]
MTGDESSSGSTTVQAPHVAVVGGGAVGTTAAAHLAERGASVTVFERSTVGDGSTGRAAGLAYDAFADPLTARHAADALTTFRDLGGEVAFHEVPYVWVATEAGDRAEAIRANAGRMADQGRAVELVDPADLRAEFPQVDTSDVVTAAVARNAGCLDPAAYADAMADRARAAGATIRDGVEVRVRADPPRVLTDDGEVPVDAVLVAAGAQTGPLLDDAALPSPVQAYRVQALSASGPAVPMLFDATSEFYVRPTRRGLIAGDGTEPSPADPDDWERSADDAFVQDAMASLDAWLINYEGSPTEAWAGLCTATPDGDPLLGPVAPGVIVAAGWHGHGVLRAPASGRAAADAVLDGAVIDRFDPWRFDGDPGPFEIRTGSEEW